MTASTLPRYNIYEAIHKGLRARMGQVLVAVGQVDVDDEDDVHGVVVQLRMLLEMMRGHLAAENAFVHAAMEARAPGSSAAIADEHVHHEHDMSELEAACNALLRAPAAHRQAIADHAYAQLDRFVRDNLAHMRYEETEHNATLWSVYADDEIRAIERELVGSIPPEKKLHYIASMFPALPTRERARLLDGIRASAPAEAYAVIEATVLPLLDDAPRARLARARAAAPAEAV
ncbi:MAG TPA: hemerythrin domain-containing protein, partial [Xanthomonadaceae bacterium]|nr:hemerythrin domain-containing protein [Xanthomonadaceae bacterium]